MAASGVARSCGMPHTKAPLRKVTIERPDSLARMRSYQLACAAIAECWEDALGLAEHPLTTEIASQLYTAVVSIAANLAEGYSRSSGRDRARLFEYALGSTRECIEWYDASTKVLGKEVVDARRARLIEIRMLLLATIPRERERNIRPAND